MMEEWAKFTIVKPHICSPLVDFKDEAAHSVKYLKEKHRAAIFDQRTIKPDKPYSVQHVYHSNTLLAAIISAERLSIGNIINYIQGHRVREAVINKVHRD